MKANKREFPQKITKNGINATIYRAENKGYIEFKVAWYEGARRQMQSFADYADALQKAEEVFRQIGAGDHATLHLKADDRIIYQRAVALLKKCGHPLDVAAERYGDAVARLGSTPLLDAVEYYVRRHPANMPTKTVAEVFNEMLKAKEADGASAVYLRDLKFRLGELAEAFACPIAGVDAPKLNEFLRALDCSGRSRNNYRTAISTLFNYAEAQGYLPKEHIDFERVARAKEDQTEIEIFTPKEMMALLTEAQKNPADLEPGYNKRHVLRQGLLPLLVLGGFAGMRTAEVQRQRWSDISLERGYIRVTAGKGNTAQKRLIPIGDNLRAWLAVCRRESEVCCDYPRPWEVLLRLAERVGITWKHNALRHTCISCRVALTGDVPRVALESGNSVRMIFKHYRELVTKEEAETWFSIKPDIAENVVQLKTEAA